MKKFDFPIRAVVDEAAETRVVGAIKIENEEVLVGFRQTIEYKLSPAYDGDGALVHFLLLPIPVEERHRDYPQKIFFVMITESPAFPKTIAAGFISPTPRIPRLWNSSSVSWSLLGMRLLS